MREVPPPPELKPVAGPAPPSRAAAPFLPSILQGTERLGSRCPTPPLLPGLLRLGPPQQGVYENPSLPPPPRSPSSPSAHKLTGFQTSHPLQALRRPLAPETLGFYDRAWPSKGKQQQTADAATPLLRQLCQLAQPRTLALGGDLHLPRRQVSGLGPSANFLSPLGPAQSGASCSFLCLI